MTFLGKKVGCGAIAGIFALLFVALIAYMAQANKHGESAAHSMCDTIKIGDSLASVRAKMKAAKGSLRGAREVHDAKDPLFRDNSDFIYIEFPAGGVERYSCIANLDHAVVKQVRVIHVD
jgi:hypothetical protein